MTFLTHLTTPKQSLEAEWLDEPDQPKAALAGTFRDLRTINRWFGGWNFVDRSLRPFLPNTPKEKEKDLYLLDIAAGGADVPLALARRWRKLGYNLHITVVDLNPTIVELAQEAAKQQGVTDFEAIAADVFEYDWTQRQPFDFVTCSLAFHHFTPEQCVRMLGTMSRLSTRAFVVNDLQRSWPGWLGAKLLTATITRDPINRHDAPLSILRAYTADELLAIVARADLGSEVTTKLRHGLYARQALVGWHKDKQETL